MSLVDLINVCWKFRHIPDLRHWFNIQQMEQMWDSSNYWGISLLVRCNKIYVKILAHRINEREGGKIPKRISAWLSESSRVPWSRHYLMKTGSEFPEGCVWLPLILLKQTCQTGGPWTASGPFQYFGGPRTFKTYFQCRQTLQFIIN